MTVFKLHTFYLPVYQELLPDDWKGDADPRAPRLLVRGPTVAEYTAMLSTALPTADKGVVDAAFIVENINQGLNTVRPMVRRCAGDWSLAALDSQCVESLPLDQLNALLDFALAAGRPDEVKDAAPLDAGLAPQ